MSHMTMTEARRVTKPSDEEAYERFVGCWQSFDPELIAPQKQPYRTRRLLDLRPERSPERYPAGGGYRILRRPLMFEEE